MLVGFTYDLRSEYLKMGFDKEETAELDKEETIEGIEKALIYNGYKVEKIGNIRNLIKKLEKGKSWDIVFNICEGMYGIGREAQVPALLDAFKIPYVFSDTVVLALTLDKGLTKRVVRDLGIKTPEFFVVKSKDDISKVNLNYPLFAKPIAEGTGKGISAKSKINNEKELKRVCCSLLKKFNEPVLVEEFLPGREFTVGLLGTGSDAKALGTMEVLFGKKAEKNAYSYQNKENYQGKIDYTVPEKEIVKKCEELSLKVWKGLGCRDAGRIDVRIDKNNIPNFIEINPLAGLNLFHSDLPIIAKLKGIDFNNLIKMIMDSALRNFNKEGVIIKRR